MLTASIRNSRIVEKIIQRKKIVGGKSAFPFETISMSEKFPQTKNNRLQHSN